VLTVKVKDLLHALLESRAVLFILVAVAQRVTVIRRRYGTEPEAPEAVEKVARILRQRPPVPLILEAVEVADLLTVTVAVALIVTVKLVELV
jgi:hypothetical protein